MIHVPFCTVDFDQAALECLREVINEHRAAGNIVTRASINVAGTKITVAINVQKPIDNMEVHLVV
jgi:hypothetical protein